jgi:S1-C subfamily serine protease
MIYAAIGIGGLAVVLLCVVLAVLLTRGNGEPPARVAGSADVAQPDPQARALDSAIAIEPAATPGAATSTVTATSAIENTDSAPTAPPAIDGPEIVRRLKESTVYLKNVVGGKTLASGTGFVIEVRGDTVMLATNRHVAVPDLSEVPARLIPKGSIVGIEAVFRSGQGPQSEQALPAQIIAADTSDAFSTDLAFLIVKGVKRPPSPVNVFVKSDTTEGMAYTGAGFPLGGMLGKITESKGNPSVTITGGRIAALRRDDQGQVALFQVDGSLQPGNSGGPIVEEKTGKFVGVAVAKVGAVDTIGFVVPADEVRRALGGRVGSIDGTRLEGAQGTAELQVRAEVVDPRGLVKSVMVHIAPASAGTISPNSDGSWPPLPNTKGVELQRDPKTPFATGRVKVALSGQGADARKVLIQTAHRDTRGQLVYSKPREVELPEKGPFGRGGNLQRAMKAVQHKSLAMLGPLLDPDNDCKLSKDEDKLTIKIDVPGKLHTLSPEVTTRKNRKVSLNNAPITMTEVEGDFAAYVQVTGEISPGAATPKDRQGHTLRFTVQSAGLILYQDKANFLRLERAGSIFIDNLTPVHRLIIEAVKDGKQAMRPIYVDVPEANTLLVLVRRKGRVTCMFSPNGGQTTYMFREFALDLPTKVNVGLTAANISAKPFSATFDTFALISDVTMIDEELGEAQKPPAKKQ